VKDLNSLVKRYPSVELKVIDVQQNPYEAQARKILGVPATFIDGSLAFVGAPPLNDIESFIQRKDTNLGELPDVTKVAELAVDALCGISTTAIRFYLYGDYESLFRNKEFSARLMKLRSWNNIDAEKLREILESKRAQFIEIKNKVLMEKIASEFVREIYWLYDEYPQREEVDRLYPAPVFAHWLMTRASMGGRIGQSIRRLSDRELVRRIENARRFTLENYDSLCKIVAQQQESIRD